MTRPIQSPRIGDPALAARLARELEGEVLFDAASRGRYSTDASIYQIEPIGVALPKTEADIARIIAIAADAGVPVLPRGAGTSQCGQTVGRALVVDVSKHLNRVLAFEPEARRVTVEPGMVLDELNAFLAPHGLFFPVDVSTANRATIGGMTGNNSCGAHSVRYGLMRRNVAAIDGILASGEAVHFGELPADSDAIEGPPRYRELAKRMVALGTREAGEMERRFPKVHRRIGGYNIDSLAPPPEGTNAPRNMAHLLVGSEGTLAFSTRIHLHLAPLPRHRVLGICHFPTFPAAMQATRPLMELAPSAVELVDRTMIDLARRIPLFRATVEKVVQGRPSALLIVEFAGDDEAAQLRDLNRLHALMGDLGYPGGVVEARDAQFQKEVWEVRKAGLNIMMSMKGDGKPISFIEDCAVPLEHLADYTERLTQVFAKHGTTGTWYAHASEGCLHVRPILNMKDGADVRKMRAIAEEAFAMVREYKGSHSGEHGDGIVRSEFHAPMFGGRMVANFEEVKDAFDPRGLFNPGKIVRPPKMDDRSLFRYRPDYGTAEPDCALDWSEAGGFAAAVEMCNNNGACRKRDAAVMCPSYRATGDEVHSTRGRANTLRLALSGQLGGLAQTALASDAVIQALGLCVGCKGCRRECPTGVDMARMKIEVLYHRHRRHGLAVRDRLVAFLPRYAPTVSRLAMLANLRDRVPGLAALSEKLLGLSRWRPLPRWSARPFRPAAVAGPLEGPEVVLLADTFNTYFEPDNLEAAHVVLTAAGVRVHSVAAADGPRPLCCGRTFLSVGLIDEARAEARRMIDALAPYVEHGMPIIGLEPACLLTLRDEFAALLPGAETQALAGRAVLFEEYLAGRHAAGDLDLDLGPVPWARALVHGHCHQKAFDTMGAVEVALGLVPGLAVETVPSSCCGLAGAFGYEAENYGVSMDMGELSLLPAVRAADADTVIAADGTSCRGQIKHGAGREALHVARILKAALGD